MEVLIILLFDVLILLFLSVKIAFTEGKKESISIAGDSKCHFGFCFTDIILKLTVSMFVSRPQVIRMDFQETGMVKISHFNITNCAFELLKIISRTQEDI